MMNAGVAVTFLTVSHSMRQGKATAAALGRSSRARSPSFPKRNFDEDSARRALGIESVMPSAAMPGVALENLARIALG